MAFQPMAGDRSSEYIFAGLNQAQAMENMRQQTEGQQWSDVFQGIGQNLEQAGGVFVERMAKDRSNSGKLQAIADMNLLPPEQLDKLAAIKDPDKLAGAMAVVDDMIQMQQRKDLMKYQAGLESMGPPSRVGTTTTLTDPVTGQDFGAYFQNDRQVVPFRQPNAGPGAFQTIDLGNGIKVVVDGNGKPVSKNALQGLDADPLAASKRGALETKVANLTGQVAERGADAKNGPNWWPFSSPLGKQLEGAQAELAALNGNPPAAPAAKPASNGGSMPKVTTKEQYAALPSGTTYIGKDGKTYRKP